MLFGTQLCWDDNERAETYNSSIHITCRTGKVEAGSYSQRNQSPHLKVWFDRLRPVWDGVKAMPKVTGVVAAADFEDTGIERSFRMTQGLGGPVFKGSSALWQAADLIRKKAIFPILHMWDREKRKFPPPIVEGLKRQGVLNVWYVHFIRAGFKQMNITPREPVYINRPIYGPEQAGKQIVDAEDLGEAEIKKKKGRGK